MSTAVRRTRVMPAARVAPQPAARPAQRPPLEVVAPRARSIRRRSLAPLLSGAVVSLSLLSVVIGHAELVQGQMRLADVQSEITSARLLHQREGLTLANLENPSRILRVAEDTLHMAPPTQVRQLAHVPLTVALPAPHVTPSSGGSPARTAASGG
ncbi:MAG TPA: hypothetical protein VND62_12405 [Acidimicrobiales bacterium]|nr:hypothetical protein [Acidimicrobiales bacterium]